MEESGDPTVCRGPPAVFAASTGLDSVLARVSAAGATAYSWSIMRWRSAIALAASLVTAALVLAGVGLMAVEPSRATVALALVGGGLALVWAALGALVARRARGNAVGLLLVAVGAMVALTATRE